MCSVDIYFCNAFIIYRDMAHSLFSYDNFVWDFDYNLFLMLIFTWNEFSKLSRGRVGQNRFLCFMTLAFPFMLFYKMLHKRSRITFSLSPKPSLPFSLPPSLPFFLPNSLSPSLPLSFSFSYLFSSLFPSPPPLLSSLLFSLSFLFFGHHCLCSAQFGFYSQQILLSLGLCHCREFSFVISIESLQGLHYFCPFKLLLLGWYEIWCQPQQRRGGRWCCALSLGSSLLM